MIYLDAILRSFTRLAAILALGALALFFWEGRQVEHELRKTAADADGAVLEVHKRVVDTSQNLNALLIQAGLTADEARRASIEQRQYWNKLSAETIAAVKDARALVEASTTGVNQTTADLHGVATTAQLDLVTLDSTLQSLDNTVRDADRNFANNPDTTRALKSLADSAEQVNKTAGNVEAMSEDVKQKVHDLTHPKPGKLWKSVLGWLLNTAYKVKALL